MTDKTKKAFNNTIANARTEEKIKKSLDKIK